MALSQTELEQIEEVLTSAAERLAAATGIVRPRAAMRLVNEVIDRMEAILDK